MAENINITCNIKNETGKNLTVHSTHLKWGKFQIAPSEIQAEETICIGQFKASGRSGSASGTEGYVTYRASDGTLFKIIFDICWGTKANSISYETLKDGLEGNPSDYDFYRTKSDYSTKETSGDPGSSPVTTYFYISKNK
ncbi:MAG TPA: aegerolysin family protein [Rickettsiales bacterium]|nr:aegerolysin family protein [Rickettsiales bacterium]